MKTILAIFTSLLLAMPIQATPQVGDQLILNDGTKKRIHNFTLNDAAKEKLDTWKEKKGYSGVSSTGNHDGFYANLQIKGTKLSVKAYSDKKGFFYADVPLSLIFGRKSAIAADWFSGGLWEFFGE